MTQYCVIIIIKYLARQLTRPYFQLQGEIHAEVLKKCQVTNEHDGIFLPDVLMRHNGI